ncbi:hypothetical protein D4R89_05735 [bacterium]|nr:MAG: hypothetical protein D4R89_05735 [bacterium]
MIIMMERVAFFIVPTLLNILTSRPGNFKLVYSSSTLGTPGSLIAFNPVSKLSIWGELGKRLMGAVGCARPSF